MAARKGRQPRTERVYLSLTAGERAQLEELARQRSDATGIDVPVATLAAVFVRKALEAEAKKRR